MPQVQTDVAWQAGWQSTWRVNWDARHALGSVLACPCLFLMVRVAHASSVMTKTRAAKQMCLHGKLDGILPLTPASLNSSVCGTPSALG